MSLENTDANGVLYGADAQQRAQDNMVKGSRGTMMAYLGHFPNDVQEMVYQGKLKFADTVLYSARALKGNNTIKFFEAQDVKLLGVRNVVAKKTPKDFYFALHSIQLRKGVVPTVATAGQATDQELLYTQWKPLSDNGDDILKNGEITLRSDNKLILHEVHTSLWADVSPIAVPGLYVLDNPRIIWPEKPLEMEYVISDSSVLDQDMAVMAVMRGTTLVTA